MDVLAVKGGDKRLVEPGNDGMGHIVTPVLDFLQLVEPRLHAGGVLEDVMEEASALSEVLRHIGEHAEEFRLPRNQTDHELGGSSGRSGYGLIVPGRAENA